MADWQMGGGANYRIDAPMEKSTAGPNRLAD